jgi:hypothetical protein
VSWQVDYILGDNPLRMSYMVGYGPRYPQRIHHRGSSLPSVRAHPARIRCKEGSRYFLSPNANPNVHVGAVVGGPNVTDAFPDSRPFFQESEPTTYINAPLVGLLAYFSAHPWFPQCKLRRMILVVCKMVTLTIIVKKYNCPWLMRKEETRAHFILDLSFHPLFLCM